MPQFPASNQPVITVQVPLPQAVAPKTQSPTTEPEPKLPAAPPAATPPATGAGVGAGPTARSIVFPWRPTPSI